MKKTTFFRFTINQNGIKKAVKKRGRKKSFIPVQRDFMFTRLEDCASLDVIIREGKSLRKK